MFVRASRRGVVGALAAVPTASRGCKMARERRHGSCPSFSKVYHSYFLGILLNRFGLRVASARKVCLFSPSLRLLSL